MHYRPTLMDSCDVTVPIQISIPNMELFSLIPILSTIWSYKQADCTTEFLIMHRLIE